MNHGNQGIYGHISNAYQYLSHQLSNVYHQWYEVNENEDVENTILLLAMIYMVIKE